MTESFVEKHLNPEKLAIQVGKNVWPNTWS